MPFHDIDEYHADSIYAILKESVHSCANEIGSSRGLRRFAPLTRVSEHAGTARVITDSIVWRLLSDHFFVGHLS
jgi:hypothetical protein